MARKILLVCGIAASLLYGAMMVAIRFEGYSAVSQTVSELSAVGAPTRPLWSLLGAIFDVLVLAFAAGVWMSAGGKRALRVVGGVLFAFGMLGAVWPFASMHQRAVLAAGGATFSDTLHIILGIVTVLLMFAAIGFGAAVFGKPFRLYSLATSLVLLVFGALSASDGPRISANLPTPWVGVWERISIFVFLLWVVMLAISLWRAPRTAGALETRRPPRGETFAARELGPEIPDEVAAARHAPRPAPAGR